jgi:valyl-tRNA synthetase
LSSELLDLEARIARSQALLSGEFAQRAPEHVVQRERDKLSDLQTEHTKLEERLAALT